MVVRKLSGFWLVCLGLVWFGLVWSFPSGSIRLHSALCSVSSVSGSFPIRAVSVSDWFGSVWFHLPGSLVWFGLFRFRSVAFRSMFRVFRFLSDSRRIGF